MSATSNLSPWFPPRRGLDWRLRRRDIYGEEAYIVESIGSDTPQNERLTFTAWTLRGHLTRDELESLRTALDEVLA